MVANINDDTEGPLKSTTQAQKHINTVMGIPGCSIDGLKMYASLVSHRNEPKRWFFNKYSDTQLAEISKKLDIPERVFKCLVAKRIALMTGNMKKLFEANDFYDQILDEVKVELRALDNSRVTVYDGVMSEQNAVA